jgi:hypothetical protein
MDMGKVRDETGFRSRKRLGRGTRLDGVCLVKLHVEDMVLAVDLDALLNAGRGGI